MGLSVNQLGGVGEKQLSLGFELAAENEERGGEQTDCMSEAGRVSNDTSATQYLDCRWNAVEEFRHDNEAGRTSQA